MAHPDDIAAFIQALATDEDLYDRVITTVEHLATPRPHDGHAPETLTVERLAADIAAAI